MEMGLRTIAQSQCCSASFPELVECEAEQAAQENKDCGEFKEPEFSGHFCLFAGASTRTMGCG